MQGQAHTAPLLHHVSVPTVQPCGIGVPVTVCGRAACARETLYTSCWPGCQAHGLVVRLPTCVSTGRAGPASSVQHTPSSGAGRALRWVA